MTDTEKLALLKKLDLLALGAMQMLTTGDIDPLDMDEDLYGIWLEFQAAWMSTRDLLLKMSVGGMEANKDAD